MSLGFAARPTTLLPLTVLFVIAGVYVAVADTTQAAYAADLLSASFQGTGYGVLSTVNGVGLFLSSAVVRGLWALVGPSAGFGYGAALSLVAAVLLGLRPISGARTKPW